MNFKKLYITISLLITSVVLAQVGIGTNNPQSILDIKSTNSGVLLPSISNTNAITTPQEGMIIYNPSSSTFNFYDGTSWINLIKQSDISNFAGNSGQVKLNGYNTGSGTIKPILTFIGNGGGANIGTFLPIQYFSSLVFSSAPTTTWPHNIISPSDSDFYDFTNNTFIENAVLGQVNYWRFIVKYSGKSTAAAGLTLRMQNPSPDSNFILQDTRIAPKNTSNGTLIFILITVSDQLSVPAPLGNANAKGYEVSISSDDDIILEIDSITRISLAK